MIRIATWNIEHFNDYFNKDNSLKTGTEPTEKFTNISDILNNHVKPDIIGIVEAPNTTATTGNQDGVKKLENFANQFGLSTTKALQGYLSRGSQELIFLYNPNKLSISHKPEGATSKPEKDPKFNLEFHFDADDDKIKEIYEHYRPPLEVKVALNNGKELWLMLVHAKSKGIFNSVDQVHLERMSRRNRLKLYGECTWIRRRIESWLDKGRKVVVMGDMNDGPGMDLYEARYGKSAVEILMGDIFYPDKLLVNYVGRPKFGRYGWEPASARFRDRITEDYINVLIDHVLVSQNVKVKAGSARVWNPYQAKEGDPIKSMKDIFTSASDHFPVSIDINE